ncbi:MAG TPA: hypothetical protein VGC97_06115 [Pyrinomonadaceae bacterium]|jgi:hypothetical protein
MEPSTIVLIATTVVNTVVPFLNKGAEKIVEKGAEEAFTKRAEIWDSDCQS